MRSRHQGGRGFFPFLAGALVITAAALVPAVGLRDLAIVKGGDGVSDNCERVRRAGKKPRGGPNRES